ncbi:unnamed protein product [Parnassius apollo]|uniref:(apollo) hypothetical protein n=1 Tax=Parnassius apollo TaxID=110799 RepID=A0A8S3X645_PARAO|nr:unnamed protein product [Parnassius apollo]
MLKTLWVLASFAVICISGQRAASNADLEDAEDYFIKIMNAMVTELEENYGWWNLKLLDVSQTLNEHMYNWHVAGRVNYTNGFVVSIEEMELLNIRKGVQTTVTTSNTTEWTGLVWGDLKLLNVKVGLDVIVQLDGQPVQYYTGTYTHSEITITCTIRKNFSLNEYNVVAQVTNMRTGTGVRMIYMPANHVTEVLSRRYVPSNNWDGATTWCRGAIQPILLALTEKIPFPNVCFACSN